MSSSPTDSRGRQGQTHPRGAQNARLRTVYGQNLNWLSGIFARYGFAGNARLLGYFGKTFWVVMAAVESDNLVV